MIHNTNYYNGKSVNSQVELNLFTGNFPKREKHTCKTFGAINSDGDSVKLITYKERAWRKRNSAEQCQGCLYDHVYRYTKQVEAEVNNDYNANWGYIELSEIDFKCFRNRLKSKKSYNKGQYKRDNINCHKLSEFRYLAFPQENHKLLLIHNSDSLEESTSIPLSITRLFKLIKTTVENMPTKSRTRSSQGFGLHYKGTRGFPEKQSKPNIKITFNKPQLVRGLLLKNKIKYKREGYQIDILTLLKVLKENNIKYNIILCEDKIAIATKEAELAKQKEIDELLWQLRNGLSVEEDNKVLMRLGELTGKVI